MPHMGLSAQTTLEETLGLNQNLRSQYRVQQSAKEQTRNHTQIKIWNPGFNQQKKFVILEFTENLTANSEKPYVSQELFLLAIQKSIFQKAFNIFY